ncbi:4,5-DOPA dioxygenase extradiol [Psychrobacter sp. PL15]|uniref:DODA-type extradiol aromatic ring-opening family dioxygenase n=1 Tax=unclassified Psychrobacter TaxID=196806 RepID=UPI001AE26611|nr:class III extradiol ring-cleavage dioxygenase [Psychrobacter sp. PL15]MEC5211293.1 4,5-DOPA dioxygenase extradiol [Psychrobacter sp. PL15]
MSYPKFANSNVSNPSQYRDYNRNAADTTTPITGAVAWSDAPAGLTNAARLPALFISHGAPTLAIEQSATTSALARMGQNLPKPRAIIIMSAHWLSSKLEISSNPKPKTWHDFSGFDPELYQLEYPAAGNAPLAESLAQQLSGRGIACSVNPIRVCDHGVWSPLRHLYPQADVPIIQISLPQHYDSVACYQLGAQLAHLRSQQIMIIGSGNITHNLQALRWQSESVDYAAKDFKLWLLQQLKTDVPTALDWQQYPNFRNIHPSDEHLLPLFFALGAGQRVSVVHESMTHHSLGMDIYRFD